MNDAAYHLALHFRLQFIHLSPNNTGDRLALHEVTITILCLERVSRVRLINACQLLIALSGLQQAQEMS
jgi:hypothetical protein